MRVGIPADLKQLLVRTSPGKWYTKAAPHPDNAGGYDHCIYNESQQVLAETFEITGMKVKQPAGDNAALIVAMHEALPALLASHEALSAEVAGLRASLGAIMKLIGDGTLVRDISGDAEPGWAMKQLPLVMALKTAQELLDAARGQEKKDA